MHPQTAGASAEGTLWTINVPITFAPTYAGPKHLWAYADSPGGATSWQYVGPWTVRARIDAVLPSPGVVGGTVTLTGLGFGTGGTVRFNGHAATIAPNGWSNTSITATIPAGATTGPVVVTTAGQDSNGVSYTIVDGPQLSHLSPSWGPVATTVTLHGVNFGATAGSVQWHQDRDATSGWQAVAHVNGSWAETSVQVVIPSGLVTGFFKVVRAGVPSNGQPFTVGSEEVLYYHTDGIGSLRLVTGVQGHVLARHEYQPFGEEWLAAGAHDADRIGFAGKELDQETGSGGWMALNYFGARYLHSASGRFTSVDPIVTIPENIVDPQRWNRYVYVRNNPLRYVDPDGRKIDFTDNPKAKARFERLAAISATFGKAYQEALESETITVVVRPVGNRRLRGKAPADVTVGPSVAGRQYLIMHIDHENSRAHDDVYAHEMGHVDHAMRNLEEFLLLAKESMSTDPESRRKDHDDWPVEQIANEFKDRVMREVRDHDRSR